MTKAAHHTVSDLPAELPLFPLPGVLLLPRGQLPLNIFETRYTAMVDTALQSHRLIGMIQPRDDGSLYETGCAGRITAFHETSDGRYEIVLTGITRFRIKDELPQIGGYRRAQIDWSPFAGDLEPMSCLDMDRTRLKSLLKSYFDRQDLTCSWDAVDSAGDEKLMATLAMICPFSPKEKQALLEASCCKERAKIFMTLLEMESCGDCGGSH